MPLFESALPVEEAEIGPILLQKWGVKIQKLLKASQNHTFAGSYSLANVDYKCSVRVTPDPQGIHQERIKNQLEFVWYCHENKLNHCCAPLRTQDTKELFVRFKDYVIVVFQWAQGEPVNFFALTWMSDTELIDAWGRYFAELHAISRKFSLEKPEVASKVQLWNQIHHGVLKKIILAEQDQKDVENGQHFGVIHGDLNTSNIYFNRQAGHLSAYDTDQTQRGFYQWDLSQAIFGVVMLKEAGMPLSGDPVPQADRQFFQERLIQAYEKVAGQGAVDRARLNRMVDIKREFYRLFCEQALQEGNIPKDMEGFIKFIVNAFGKKKQGQAAQN